MITNIWGNQCFVDDPFEDYTITIVIYIDDAIVH